MLVKDPIHVSVAELRPPVGMLHNKAASLAENLIPDIEGRSQSSTVIGRRGLNKYLLKRGPLANLAVEYAVHGTTTREAQLCGSCSFVKSAKYMRGGFFVNHL